MASEPDKQIEAFRAKYLTKLVDAYKPTRILLFGSRVRGTHIKQSDLDLLIVSRLFEGIPFIARAQRVLWTLQTPFPVEVLCYTPEEYERKRREIGIVSIASEEGVDLLRGEKPQSKF